MLYSHFTNRFLHTAKLLHEAQMKDSAVQEELSNQLEDLVSQSSSDTNICTDLLMLATDSKDRWARLLAAENLASILFWDKIPQEKDIFKDRQKVKRILISIFNEVTDTSIWPCAKSCSTNELYADVKIPCPIARRAYLWAAFLNLQT